MGTNQIITKRPGLNDTVRGVGGFCCEVFFFLSVREKDCMCLQICVWVNVSGFIIRFLLILRSDCDDDVIA